MTRLASIRGQKLRDRRRHPWRLLVGTDERWINDERQLGWIGLVGRAELRHFGSVSRNERLGDFSVEKYN